MKFKVKKRLLLILILVAVVSTIISSFTPILVWDSEDYYSNKYDIDNPNLSWRIECSYFLTHTSIKDYRDDFTYELNIYQFFLFFVYETGNSELKKIPTDYDLGNTGFFTISTFNMIKFISFSMALIVFLYLVFLSVKNLGVKKKNYFLYIGIGHIILLTFFAAGFYFYSANFLHSNLASGISLGYGIFVAVFSICLFLFLHFKQGLLLEDKDNLKDNGNV